MLTNSKSKSQFESTTEVSGQTLVNLTVAHSEAANASEFKDPKATQRRERRRARTSRNVRNLGSIMGGWKVTSW
jgi:hypothetical protein